MKLSEKARRRQRQLELLHAGKIPLNKKQRRKLERFKLIALIAFVVIGALHYFNVDPIYCDGRVQPAYSLVPPPCSAIPDVRVPFFMLGVIYFGLFFLLADKKEKR